MLRPRQQEPRQRMLLQPQHSLSHLRLQRTRQIPPRPPIPAILANQSPNQHRPVTQLLLVATPIKITPPLLQITTQ